MRLSAKEKKLIDITTRTMRQVKLGNPLKDFMDREDVEDALILLVKLSKLVKEAPK